MSAAGAALRVLFVGDVVEPVAVEWLAARLPALRPSDAGNTGPVGPAEGQIVLGAVLLEIERGRTRHVSRLG